MANNLLRRLTAKRLAKPTWRIFRKLGGNLFFIGIVEAPDRIAALREAASLFKISERDCARLVVELRD